MQFSDQWYDKNMNTALLTIAAIFLVGMMIPQLLARSVIGPFFRIFVIPGVIVHELAHAFFCVITGAKIRRIRLFKRDGGEVAHEQSKIPILGPLVITLAPMIIGLGLIIIMSRRIIPDSSAISFGSTIHDFPQFLFAVITHVAWRHAATWVWLYLILSIGATLAPSIQDLKNSWLPIGLIIILLGFLLKTGLYHVALEAATLAALPGLTVALFILLVIVAFAAAIYAASSAFGISK